MIWLKNKILWLMGAFIALITAYYLGKKDGKNAEKEKGQAKTIDKCVTIKHIDNLSDDDIERMPSKYD